MTCAEFLAPTGLTPPPAGRRRGANNSPSSAQHRESIALLPQATSPRSRHTPVAEGDFMNANLARHMSDRPGGVHHQPGSFFLKLRGILLPFFRQEIPSFPVKILLDPLSRKFRAPQLSQEAWPGR
jgi:hypothetical protein